MQKLKILILLLTIFTKNQAFAQSNIQPIKFYSEVGISSFEVAKYKNDFYQLVNFFQPQINSLYCGIASSVIVLNALNYGDITSNSYGETTLPKTMGGKTLPYNLYTQQNFLNNETNVPPYAVRIEEMLNYFSFKSSKENSSEKNFSCNTYITDCPWNKTNQLLFVNLNAPKLNLDSVPPSNLVFLIDISGSMDKPNRLPLLQSAFKMLADNLRERDTEAIVVYGGGVGRICNPYFLNQ